jgi:gliding motility-associated-like protein
MPESRMRHSIRVIQPLPALQFRLAGWILLWMMVSSQAIGQSCPPNIDFEKGTLDGWRYFIGNVLDQGGFNVFNLSEVSAPVDNRHAVMRSSPGDNDPFGGFPLASPDGSDYFLKLGNNTGGGEGEAITYEFTIPANRNTYSLLYYYAVVFEGPNHLQQQQPRMEIEITNLTKNQNIDCASFSFIPFGTTLPGFFQSSLSQSNAPVYCKNWTPVTINLDGNAGSTIRLTFRTGDCTFRRHFGYAYIDVASDCSGEFTGASFCPRDKEVTLTAPFGFQRYTWFNADMSRQLGTGQTITLSPLPAPGTVLNVQLVPYDGFGCSQTLTAKLTDNLQINADAGSDTLSCNLAPVRIGSASRQGLVYNWSPQVGLSNPFSANPIASPAVTTEYVLTVSSPGGGCTGSDTVKVVASNLGNSMNVIGRPQYCIGSGDSAVLEVAKAETIVWYKDGVVIGGEKGSRYRAATSGSYRAFLEDEFGCAATTPDVVVDIASKPVVNFGLNNTSQCLVGNSFNFTNSSTNQVGAMRYQWDFGNTGSSTQRDVTYSFPVAGQYEVKLIVRSNNYCGDSLSAMVTIYPNPVPKFETTATCIGTAFAPVNQTDDNIGSPVRYEWKYSNNTSFNVRNPSPVVFNATGNYSITLSVSSDQCPTPVQTLTKTLVVEKPVPAQRYTSAFAIRNVPLQLEARSIGVQAVWSPALQLSNPQSYKPVFTGQQNQDYTITLVSAGGCKTVDSLLVEIVQQAKIEVPNAFTPNADGLNDFLRPIPMGIAEIRHFRIFNRYGEIVYESKGQKPGWDGKFKGQPLPTQTVVWMVEGVGLDGSVITKKGTTVLIR